MSKDICKNVKVRKKGNYVRVYHKGNLAWTHNLKNTMRSWGSTKYRKCAIRYLKKKGLYAKVYPKR